MLVEGLSSAITTRPFPVKNIAWTYQSEGQKEELFAPDKTWADLNLLEDLPRVDFSAPPAVQVMLPLGAVATGMFEVVGIVPGGALPTYVRVLFYPRRNQITTSITNNVRTALSRYAIDPNSVSVMVGKQTFDQTRSLPRAVI